MTPDYQDDPPYSPGSLGYQREVLDRQMAAIADECGPIGRWWINRRRRYWQERFNKVQTDALRRAFRDTMGYDLPD